MNRIEKKGEIKTKILNVVINLETIGSNLRDLTNEDEIQKKKGEEKYLLNKLKNLNMELRLI